MLSGNLAAKALMQPQEGIHLDCLIMHFCLECNYALIQTLNFGLSSHIDTGDRRNSNALRSGCHRQWGHKDMRHD